jgi:hypothetical protein
LTLFDKKRTLENLIGKFFQKSIFDVGSFSPWKIASAIWNCFKVGFLISMFLKSKNQYTLKQVQGDSKNIRFLHSQE